MVWKQSLSYFCCQQVFRSETATWGRFQPQPCSTLTDSEEAQRLFSDTASVKNKSNSIMRHRLVKWWCNFLLRLASGGYKFSVRQSTSCPTKLFNSSALHQSIPDLRTIIRYPPCFYFYYLVLHFIPKPNSKLPFLNDCLPLAKILLLTASLISAKSRLATGDVGRPRQCLTVSFKKKHESSCMADLF